MGFWGNVGHQVRGLLRWDKEQVVLNLAKGGTASGYPQTGFDLLQSYGHDVLSDHLKLEHDLMARFVDYEEMDDYPELACISSESFILSPGSNTLPRGEPGSNRKLGATVEQLVKARESGNTDDLYVFAMDHASKKVVVAKAKGPVKTGTKEVYRVTYEGYRGNGESWSIKATGDHLFMLRDGEYRRVDELRAGNRLMPCSLRVGSTGYSEVYEPLRRTSGGNPVYKYVHQLVAGAVTGCDFESSEVVHHINRDKTDYRPSNLEVTTLREHVKSHWEHPGTHEEHVKKISEGTKKKWSDPAFKLRVSKTHQSREPEWLDNERAGKHKSFQAAGKLSDEHRAAIAKGRTIPLAKDVVEAALRASSSLNDASKKLNVSWNTLARRVETFGIDRDILGSNLGGPQPGESSYGNHRVVSVEYVGEEDVYDIEVPGYHNFAVGDPSGEGFIFIHNSAIDIYADDATQTESLMNRAVWVDSPDKTVQTILEDLFWRRLRIDEEIWEIARTLVKYGNNYEELLVSQDGLVGLNFLPPPTMRRIEGRRGELFGFVQDYKGRFGYCLAKGSRVWGANGMSEIQDFDETKAIVGYKDGVQTPMPLVKRHVQGTKKIFKLNTRHREIFLTDEHPVYAERPDGTREWVKVKDLKIIRYNGAKQSIDYSRSDKIVISTRMPSGEVPEWSSIQEYDPFDRKWGDKGSPSQITIPDRPTEDFCRLFGFLLGDGWIENSQRDPGSNEDAYKQSGWGQGGEYDHTSGRVYFARGTDESRNDLYESLLSSFSLEVKTKNNGEQSCVNSVQLARLLDSLGWINGAENKRIPSWVYGLPEAHREAFVVGLIDADGWDTRTSTGTPGWHIELANYDLVRDLKNMADGLGYKAGNIGSRKRKPGTVIQNRRTGKSVTIQSQRECFNLHISSTKFDQQFVAENVLGISYYGEGDVYDLEVDDEAHNFIADGVVVHNSPDEFKQLLTQRMAGAGSQAKDKYAALEDWEVCHMRLRSKHRRSIYGYSVLEPARWIWKRLMLLEDAAMVYRLQRAPQRYAFYIDVGDMPPKEAMAFLHKIRQQYKKTKFYNPQCLTAETCVTMLDGTDKSMAELVRDYADKEFDVFSYDLESGKVVPGKAKNPRLTHKDAPIWRVVLDNGATVRCTGNHPFLMRDGKYKAANTLESGDSLMPLYMSRGSKGTQGYWMYQEPSTGERRPVHRMVGESFGTQLADNSGLHVHHIDHNKANNTPDNLELLTASEHAIKHPERAEAGRKAYVKCIKDDPEFRNTISDRLENWRENSPDAQNFFSEHGKEIMAKRKELAADGQAALMAIISTEVVRDPLVVTEELVERLNSNEAFTEIYESLPTTKNSTMTSGCLFAFLKRQGFDGFKDFKNKKTGQASWNNRTYGGEATKKSENHNHKVVSVTFEGHEDVYNMDVEKYHNFALTGGVFVHNTGKLDLKYNPLSQDEDFFVPVRKGVQQTKIDVVGSPSWQHMEDIEYFKLKLYAAIKVPKVYLGSEAPRAKGVLSQEDVRFARTVLRLQRELRNGMKKMARVHLASLNINPSAVDFEIHMTTPSSIFELAQLEVRNAKADFAGRMQQFVSLHWILQKVFGLSEEEIEYIIKERHQEQLSDAEIQAKAMGLQMDVQSQGAVQQQAAQAEIQTQQQAAQQTLATAAAGGSTQASEELRAAFRASGALSRRWPQMRQHLGYKPITEQELFQGNREHEKLVEDNLETIMGSNTETARRLGELGQLLNEVKMTIPGR